MRPDTGGSSCRAGPWPSDARRTRLAASTASNARSGVFAGFRLARTYVRTAGGQHLWGKGVESRGHGEWRSLVAHPAGGRAVAGSNPVSPIGSFSGNSREHAGISAKTLGLVVGSSRLFPAVPGTRDRKRTAGRFVRSFSRCQKVFLAEQQLRPAREAVSHPWVPARCRP